MVGAPLMKWAGASIWVAVCSQRCQSWAKKPFSSTVTLVSKLGAGVPGHMATRGVDRTGEVDDAVNGDHGAP